MEATIRCSQYAQLVQQSTQTARKRRTAAEDLDQLIHQISSPPRRSARASQEKPNFVETLRKQIPDSLVPAFAELAAKYAMSGITLEFDPSDFLSGGRTIRMRFRHGAYCSELNGTVTSDMIAFLETRFSPSCDGHLMRGPALRIRGLTVELFQEFVCQRLAIMLKMVLRQ